MHIISLKALRAFWQKYPDAEGPMRRWHAIIEQTGFIDFNDLKHTSPSADYVKPFTIFNVGGNNFRVVAVVHYAIRRVYVRQVLTHAEYDAWSRKHRSGKL